MRHVETQWGFLCMTMYRLLGSRVQQSQGYEHSLAVILLTIRAIFVENTWGLIG